MKVFEHPEFDNHERVIFISDHKSGLKAIIAIHRFKQGRAAGGTRIWTYDSEEEALRDVLRLSKGMTFKAAISGISLGGAKGVIIKPKGVKLMPEDMLHAYGEAIQQLAGSYIAGEDVGCSDRELTLIAQKTKYALTLPKEVNPNSSGNSGPPTAFGVYMGIKAAVKFKLRKDSLEDLTIAVQGLGSVGYGLCRLLAKERVKLIVTDINQDLTHKAAIEFNAKSVTPEKIYAVEADVFSPCAMGAILNKNTIAELKAPIVAGSANNQLSEKSDAGLLHTKNILYAPDYVINAGGLINASMELMKGGYDKKIAYKNLERIYDTLLNIFERSEEEDIATAEMADKIAEERFNE